MTIKMIKHRFCINAFVDVSEEDYRKLKAKLILKGINLRSWIEENYVF